MLRPSVPKKEQLDKAFGIIPEKLLPFKCSWDKLIKLKFPEKIGPCNVLFDNARIFNEEQPQAKCSGIPPSNWLLDKSKICSDLISPKEEGMLPLKSFIDMFRDDKDGRCAPISIGMFPLKKLLEISKSSKTKCEGNGTWKGPRQRAIDQM